jgi:hypothetical protein
VNLKKASPCFWSTFRKKNLAGKLSTIQNLKVLERLVSLLNGRLYLRTRANAFESHCGLLNTSLTVPSQSL